MEILNNTSYLKLMWLPKLDDSILWMTDESTLDRTDIFREINTFLDLKSWHKEYEFFYRKWLLDDSQDLFDIKNDINLKLIYKIEKLNVNLKDLKLFYWFDIDRSNADNENFTWEKCPLSKLPLIKLDTMHPNNLYISPRFPIVFPS